MVKGQPNNFAIRGANAVSGNLTTFYNGPRPTLSGYNPMHLEGAIVLGIGGDNSNGGQGTFYEGIMTGSFPSDATEAAVQADIVAAKYAHSKLSTKELPVGQKISLRLTTPGQESHFIAHTGDTVNTQAVTSSSSNTVKRQASWTIRTGLARDDCYSLESVDAPGSFIRHSGFELKLVAEENTKQFKEDATFCSESSLNGMEYMFRSWNHPTRFFRHFDGVAYTATNDAVHSFEVVENFEGIVRSD
jgi:hypothetical protein